MAFDRYVPQLVPLLRAHAALPFDVLRAAVKLLGAMAHRSSARKLMHDPASAEGLMAVLSHPDSGEARPASLEPASLVHRSRATGAEPPRGRREWKKGKPQTLTRSGRRAWEWR